MSILSDSAILEEIEKGNIVISPFDPDCLGSNSYDVHLSQHLAWYVFEPRDQRRRRVLDAKLHNPIAHFEIPEEGYVLLPGCLYLGSTLEYTETQNFVPILDGKSSAGRLGIFIHATAGKGDVGFCNHWTLELSVVEPVRVYAGMPIGQLIYYTVEGEVIRPYNRKGNAKYTEKDPRPKESMMFKNKF